MTTGAARVLVVGAGIAGIACARVLVDAGLNVTIRERGRSVGGRMSSQRLDDRAADTGAQYATATNEGFSALVADWVSRGVARPWATGFHAYSDGSLRPPHAGAQRWSAAAGMRSLVVDLADGLTVELESAVTTVGPGPTADGEAWDAVVLAMPDPQAFRLLDPTLRLEREVTGDREWEAVLALRARWPKREWDADGAFDGAFINGEDTLAWIADDGARRGDGAPVLVAHSTGPFAAERLADPALAEPDLVAATQRVLGVEAPEAARVQRWTFARPSAARPEPFHLGPARIGICGDGWGAAKVETAWVSGTALGQSLAATLT